MTAGSTPSTRIPVASTASTVSLRRRTRRRVGRRGRPYGSTLGSTDCITELPTHVDMWIAVKVTAGCPSYLGRCYVRRTPLQLVVVELKGFSESLSLTRLSECVGCPGPVGTSSERWTVLAGCCLRRHTAHTTP